jgi:hypothetical protein
MLPPFSIKVFNVYFFFIQTSLKVVFICFFDSIKMADLNGKDTKESLSLQEIENSTAIADNKISTDPTLQIYLDFASRDAQWKAMQNKKLLKKVDIRLLPFLILMYLLNFLDRSNLAQARLGTLEADLGMTGTDFNLATSILFVVCIRYRPIDQRHLLTRE